jgi:ribosome-associated protein
MPSAFAQAVFYVRESEVQISAVRAQGAGGQNVNKVSSAIHLRFDIGLSSLPPDVKQRLLSRADHRITKDGVLVIKAQQHRTQEMNRLDALVRLHSVINQAAQAPKPRRATKPTQAASKRRLDHKKQRSQTKALRERVLQD